MSDKCVFRPEILQGHLAIEFSRIDHNCIVKAFGWRVTTRKKTWLCHRNVSNFLTNLHQGNIICHFKKAVQSNLALLAWQSIGCQYLQRKNLTKTVGLKFEWLGEGLRPPDLWGASWDLRWRLCASRWTFYCLHAHLISILPRPDPDRKKL